ncbi:MAG: transposase, partial [Thermodesulfovibrionales bacterium]|nr:transposase [Thermodesulfovibrionales bacterium]
MIEERGIEERLRKGGRTPLHQGANPWRFEKLYYRAWKKHMPRKPRQFVNNEIYHIVLRRIRDELLFVDTDDYYRGIFSIYEFNTTQPVEIFRRRRQIQAAKKRFREQIQEIQASGGQTPTQPPRTDNRDLLVEILAFCLMPNHIHLLVKQLKEGGISKFMQKLGAGYAAYFKIKYDIRLKGHFRQTVIIFLPLG